jgi:diguanylate cyclase (GGDEF)-like protein/PAS domain S-box-containing protein
MTAPSSDLIYRLLVQSVVDYAIYLLDTDGNVVNWNAGAERAKGYKAEEIVGRNFAVFYSAEDRTAGLPQRALATARADSRFEAEGWRLRKDGTRFWTNVVIDAIHDDDGNLVGFAKITRDITERHQQQLKLVEAKELAEQYSQQMASLSNFLDSVISNIPGSVLAIDVTGDGGLGDILLANGQARRLFAGASAELAGRRLRDCLGADVADYIEGLAAASSSGEAPPDDDLVQTPLGPRTLRSRTVVGSKPDGAGDYLLFITDDVTDELAAYAQIHHMAQHDGLTNLPNRTFFHQRLEAAIRDSIDDGSHAAILCLDLDNFKNINDAFGHGFGDKILLMLAGRLKKCVREHDTLARLGGDEFAVVLPRVKRVDEAQHAAQRLIDAVAPAFAIDGHSFTVGLSVGIAISSHQGSSAEQLLRFGDMALYEAKRNGRNRYELFHPDLEAASRVRRQVEIDLRRALHRGELQMHYQPIIEKEGCRISGYEALIRWQHPVKGQVPPMEFIPLAEETGLIHELGARALNLACQEALRWPDLKLAVNLSPLQFRRSGLVEGIAQLLAETGFPAERLELEITEGALLRNIDQARNVILALKQLGVRIAMDDFGTGYSSLSQLQRIPFDKIKIDKSFVQDLTRDPDSAAIVRAVVGLGRSLRLTTTAEGVETLEQLAFLAEEGCDAAQGFLYARALTAAELDSAKTLRLGPGMFRQVA